MCKPVLPEQLAEEITLHVHSGSNIPATLYKQMPYR